MMKQVVLIAVLAGAAAGVCGSMITSVLTLSVETEPIGAPAFASDGRVETERELAALREQNRQLSERLERIERDRMAAASQRAPARTEEPVDYAVLAERIKTLEATGSAEPGQVTPLEKSKVFAALVEIEQEKERQREIDREGRRLERVDQRITSLSEKLGMDQFQAKQMREVLLSEATRREEMMGTIRESGDFSGARERMRELRDEVDQSVSAILTTDQYEQYKETSGSDGSRRGWGGGRSAARATRG